MKKILKKDIVIKAGTVFNELPSGSTSTVHGSGHIEAVFGLTNDSFGKIYYSIDDSDKEDAEKLKEYFEDKVTY